MGKTRNGILITIIMTLVCAATLLCGTAAVHAEGSRDIVRTSAENYKAVTGSDGTTGVNQARWSLMSQSGNFMGVNRQQKIKFYAFEGETVFLASNEVENSVDIKMTQPDGSVVNVDLKTDEGFIKTSANEKAGPKTKDDKSIWLPKAETTETGNIQYDTDINDRYVAYKYDIPISGVYVLEFYTNTSKATTLPARGGTEKGTVGNIKFNTELDGAHSNAHVIAWDVTVAQPQKSGDDITHYVAVNGRVWMDAIAMQNMGRVYGDLYCVTRDGYIWRFSLNGIEPNTFAMYANSRGGIGTGTNASAYHSVHSPLTNYTDFKLYKERVDKYGNPDGIQILGPDNDVTDIDSPYHMFVNPPDTTISESIVLSQPKPIGTVKNIQFDGKSNDLSDTVNTSSGYAGVGGSFEVETEGASSYRIIIDMSKMYAKHYHNEAVDGGKYDTDGSSTGNHDDEICLSTDSDLNFIYYNDDSAKGDGVGWYSIKTHESSRHPSNDKDLTQPEAMKNHVTYEKLTGGINLGEGITVTDDPSNSENAQILENAGYKSLGKIMLGNAAVDGTNRIKWDGRDQYGRILPIGTYFGSTGRGEVYAEPKAGEIHFPLGDVEQMINGVAIWLESEPQGWMSNVSTTQQQIDYRSRLYYNNLDMSLLRDFEYNDTVANNGMINNTWIWNLPNNTSNIRAGEVKANSSKINRGWVTDKTIFEDMSIDGTPSYKYDTSKAGDRAPTNLASKFTNDTSIGTSTDDSNNFGCDHGIVDVWTYAAAPESAKVYLDSNVTINNVDYQKILTGFVFLDTPVKGTVQGDYDKLTDDRELPGAKVVVSYGTYGNIKKKLPDDATYKDKSPDEPVTFETSTNSNGYYSVPINMYAFSDDAGDKQEITVTVTYSDPLAGPAAVTHKVTTIDKKVRQFTVSQEMEEGHANVSVQKIQLKKDGTGNKSESMKEIYADDVGYIISPSTSLRIHAQWTPDCLKDMSMAANFSVYGVYKSTIEKSENSKFKELLEKELPTHNDGYTYNDQYVPLAPKERDELKAFFQDTKNNVYSKEDIELDLKMSAVETIEDLPGIVFKTEKSGEKTQAVEADKIIYRVFYNGTAPSDSIDLKRNQYKAEGGGTFDNWEYTIKTDPSTIKETVWFDANHNSIFDEGEQPIVGARVQIAKRNSNISGDLNQPENYEKSFQRIKKNLPDDPDYDSTHPDDEWTLDKTVIDSSTTAFVTNEKGEVCNTSYTYNPDTNEITEEVNPMADNVGIQGLIAGTYRLTITLPPGSTYNSAAYTGAGMPDGPNNSSLIIAEFDQEHNQIIQYIDVPANAIDRTEETGKDGSVQAKAAYSYMADLSIRKSVEAYNTTNKSIERYVKPSLFAFKLKMSNITIEEPETSVTLPVEDAVTELSLSSPNVGVEGPGDPNKTITFKKQSDGSAAAVFTLSAGERITINNVPNGTEYEVTELDIKDALLDGIYDESIKDDNLKKLFDTKKNMRTGFGLSAALGNPKTRKGKISDTARTSMLNFTNRYEPLPVTAYGGKEPEKKRDEEINPSINHNSINIQARVLINTNEGEPVRNILESDNFSLVLEPSTWFTRDEDINNRDKHTPQDGLSPDVVEITDDGKKNTHNIIDVETPETPSNEATVTFDDKYTMTFTQPGVYTYVLRERKPFTTDNVDPIPGIKYAPETYKLYIEVNDDASDIVSANAGKTEAGTGHLVVANYFWRARTGFDEKGEGVDDWDLEWNTRILGSGTGGADNAFNKTPLEDGKSMLVFNNTYDLAPPEVAFEGTKILNGRALGDKEFEFKIEPVGKYEIGHTENKTPDAVASMPTPESDTTWNTAATGTNNIKFDPITFTEDDAGEDEASAIIYHYQISEIKPEDDSVKPSVEYDTKKQDVYVRVYKEVVADPDNEGQFYQIVHALQCDADGNSTSGFAFTNSYTAKNLELSLSGDNSLGLKLKKTLISKGDSSRKFKDGDEFRFVIEPENGAPAISGGAEGRPAGVLIFGPEGDAIGQTEKSDIEFASGDKIEFIEANTTDKPYYEYTIRELNPYGDASVTTLPGISYDGTRYRLRVYVKDDTAQGKLVLDTEKSESKTGIDVYKITDESEGELLNESTDENPAAMPELEFTNNYDPNKIDVPLSANKSFNRDFTTFFGTETGTDKMNQGFGFTLTPIGFVDDISSVGELTPFKAGVLKTDGEGYESEANMPMPDVGKQYTEGSKDFYIDSTGLIDLKNMSFESEDAGITKATAKVYIYKIKENNENRGGVTYDEKDRYIFLSVYMLTDDTMGDNQYVTVALNDTEDIAKIAEKHSEYKDANIDYTFVNTYNPNGSEFDLSNSDSLKIIKKVTTQNVDAPEFTEGQFQVKLEPFNSSNSQLPPGFINEDGYVTFNIDASGKFVFDKDNSYEVDSTKLNGTRLMFDSEGTYEYLIREVTPAEDGIDGEDGYTYDTYQYKLTLDVKDDLQGNMKITPSVQWRSSLGGSWSGEFDESLDDPHMPDGYKERDDKNISATDIVFVNSYTQRHTLNYNPNGALAGGDSLPPQTEYEKNMEITVHKTEGALTRNQGEMFVGWSTYEKDGGYTDEERTAALTAEDAEKAKALNILSADDDGTDENPGNTENNVFKMPDANAILYAVWAIDANGNNTPDYAEDGYSVEYYIGNAVVDPDSVYADKTNKILYTCEHHHVAGTDADFLSHNGNTVTVNGTEVKLSLPDSGNPAFIGWSLASSYKEAPVVDEYPGVFSRENLSGLISSINLTEELMKNTDLIKSREDGRKVLTVYAVWAGDTHGGQVLPPSEPTLGPDETPRPTADPDATPSPTATPGPETSDGIPDYKQVAYRGNKPTDADQEVVGVPVDGNEYIPGESYVSLLTAPSLDGYRFLGWTDVETPTDDTIYYQPGMHWGPKTNKLDLFYAQWAENEQSLIIQVFDDANNDGTYGGEETLLGISTEKITLTPKNSGDTIESVEHTDGGGVQFTSAMLKPGDYTLTITIDEDQFNVYDRYTGVNYALGDEQGTITTKLEGTKLTINQDITIPYEDYSGAIRYGVTRPYDVIYNMNGAPVEVGLKTDAVPDKDYAYHDGDTVPYYTDSEGREYDGKIAVLGADSLNETIDSSNGKYIFTDSAGLTHEFLGWSINSDASAPDTGMSVSELAEGGTYRNKSFKEMPAGDLTLYAVWDRGFNKYPLTFDANGGQYESGGEDALNGTLIDLNKRYVIVSEKDASIPLDENSENRPGYKNAEEKVTFPEISREDAVFIGWSATALGVVSDYNTVKDSLLSSIQMLTANTVYAVWAEDTRGKLVDSEGRSCDTPNVYYGDGHSDCAHGELIKHESDGIADYLQVFYEFNAPSDAKFSGSLNVDPVTYGVDGKYTLNKSVLETFKNTDADAIRQKDYENASAGEISDDNAAAYIRSSSLAVEGYAFDGWSVNDPSGANGKAENGMFYAGPTNGLGRAYSFEKSSGRPDTLYAIWRKIVPAAVNVRVYNDANRDGVCEPGEGLVTGFTIDSVYEVITQSYGGDLEEAFEKGFPLTDKGTDDARTGSAFINWFEPGKYKMTLTLDGTVSDNTSFVIRTLKDAHSFVSLDGTVEAKDMELQILNVNNRTITFQYSPKEGFAGDLNIAATQGYTLEYDTNGAPADKVAAPESVNNLYYDNETNVAEQPKKADGTELENDEDGYFYSDDNGVKHYFLGWSENKYSDTPEYSADGTSHKVTDRKITI